MLFNGKTIEAITENDLQGLVGAASESQTLDFKRDIYQTDDEDNGGKLRWKLRFCDDLSSFANAFGGWIICGMLEDGGLATEVCGLGPDINPDDEILRLQQIANTGIEPRIPNLRFRAISLTDSAKSKALMIYIPRSFIGPHRVRETSKFHFRHSNGKHEMSVDELRIAFNLAANLAERVKDFRRERVEILARSKAHEDIPVVLAHGPFLMLHSIPLTTLSVGTNIELVSFEFANKAFPHPDHLNAFVRGARFNFHGAALSHGMETNRAEEYFQIFRNGTIEYVNVLFPSNSKSSKLVSPFKVENTVLINLPIMLSMQRNLGIELPVTIMMSLVDFNGFTLDLGGNELYFGKLEPFNRDRILIPDIVLTDYDQDLKIVLKPVFDILWNTGGLNRSASYNESGGWDRPGPI